MNEVLYGQDDITDSRPPKVVATLSKDQRYYICDVAPAPLARVSTILNCAPHEGLETWRRKVGFEKADEISKTSTDLGTRVHAACEAVDLGLPYETDTELDRHVAAWLRFKDDYVAEVEDVEYFVYSVDHQYAGTVDRRLRLKNGMRVIGDIKTSKTMSPTYGIQLRAYEEAEVEMGLERCDGRLVINLPSNNSGKYGVKWYADPNDWIAFRALNFTFKYFRERADDWKQEVHLV